MNVDDEILATEARLANKFAMRLLDLASQGLLTDAQADRLIDLLDADDPEAAAEETARIMAEALERAGVRRSA